MARAESSAALLKELALAARRLEVGPAESPAPAVSDVRTAELPMPAVSDVRTVELPAPKAAEARPTEWPVAQASDVDATESALPEPPDRSIDFGPLPMVIRPSPPAERKTKRDRRRSGGGRSPGVVLYWLTGVFLGGILVWALASAFAQQPLAPRPAASPSGRNAPAATTKQQQQQSHQQQSPQQQGQQQAPQQQPALPVTTEQALYLIRSTLLTLNDANRSGNSTVLRDLAAPDFQARNSAADLSQSFSDLRHRNFDLYGAALLAPQLTAVPTRDQHGFLHLTGFFPTRPQQINFDLLFQDVSNQWRLFGIAVTTPDAPVAGR